MVLRLCPGRSHNLLSTFGTFHELENSLRMPINGLCNLKGLLGGPRKPTWRWNLNFFFMESISNVKVATNLKKEANKVQRKKTFYFFAQIQPGFIQCTFIFCWALVTWLSMY